MLLCYCLVNVSVSMAIVVSVVGIFVSMAVVTGGIGTNSVENELRLFIIIAIFVQFT